MPTTDKAAKNPAPDTEPAGSDSMTSLSPPGPDAPVPSPEGGAPAVLSERGSRIVRLNDWTTTEFRCVLGEGDDAQKVTLTPEGLRVTVAQAQLLQEAAAAHGVTVTVEEVAE